MRTSNFLLPGSGAIHHTGYVSIVETVMVKLAYFKWKSVADFTVAILMECTMVS